MKPLTFFSTLVLTSSAIASPDYGQTYASPKIKTIFRDVCVIGGGSSGTYAAIRLQQHNRTIVVVEKQSIMGGHTDTYKDPVTGKTVDYGVVVFSNISVTRDYFAHWNIPLVAIPTSSMSSSKTQNVNFETGQVIPAMMMKNQQAEFAATLKLYAIQLAKYPGIEIGYNLTYPVPQDLLMKFGDFLVKYNLTALAGAVYLYNQGLGNLLAQPTLFVMKYFDLQQVEDFEKGFVVNALNDNQLIYDKARAQLGKDVFLNSFPLKIVRNKSWVSTLISTPTGPLLIRSSKLIISIPPTLFNLQFLDLEDDEMGLFGQFNHSYYWDAIIRNTGLPAGAGFNNLNPAAPFAVPAMPSMYSLSSTPIPDVWTGYYGSAHFVPDNQVRAAMLATIARIRKGQALSPAKSPPQIVELGNHNPFMLTVSPSDVAGGFYKRLQALQGQKRTWYTGAAWDRPASSNLWRFTEEVVLPPILKKPCEKYICNLPGSGPG